MADNYFMLTLPAEGNENFMFEYLSAPTTVADNPPLPSDDKIDPNMTLGEMMDKNVSPSGMIPMWTEPTRKKYEACISPHIALIDSPLTISTVGLKKIIIIKHTVMSAQVLALPD